MVVGQPLLSCHLHCLEVILNHQAYTICRVLIVAHILACAVEILNCHSELRGDIAEDIAKDVAAGVVLVFGQIAIVLLKRYHRASACHPGTTR